MLQKHNYTGASMLELQKKYGTGLSGFYSKDPWWKDEVFAKEKPDAGMYEIDLRTDLVNMTFDEQKEKLDKEFDVIHPAILIEAIFEHFKKTGERLLENNCVRTSSIDSDGLRVDVGHFDSGGLHVGRYWDDRRLSYIGLSGARKLSLDTGRLETFESLSVRVENLEATVKKLTTIVNI